MKVCTYHRLNITKLSNERRQLTATFAKCNLHKWNTLYTYYNFTQCTIYVYMYFFFLGGGEGNFGEGSILFMLLILAF